MFRPIEEYVEGVACATCWGIGKTFGDVPTPKRVTMTGSGFVGAEAVCNGTFIMTQDAILPCKWNFDDGSARGNWFMIGAATTFIIGISGGGDAYNRPEGLCKKVSTFAGETVSIEIAEPPTPEYKIATDQNFSPSLQTHYRNLGAVGPLEVLQLAHRLDRINVLAKFEPEY